MKKGMIDKKITIEENSFGNTKPIIPQIPLNALGQNEPRVKQLLAEIPNIIGLLENCKYKLRLYRIEHSGEYIGGTEYNELIKQINDMQEKLSKQSV